MEKLSPAMLIRIKSNLDQDIVFMRGMQQMLEFYSMEKKAEADSIPSERRSGESTLAQRLFRRRWENEEDRYGD